jgi:eukaryotic-like serine/threonine-protein kinase
MVPERYGAYRVFEQLGTGGMATVHRAEQDTPEGVRQVALKRLLPTTDRKPVTLFLDEARLLRYLHHPNIPETYDSGRVFGTYFIAMEYIDGPTLKQLIEHCAKTVGPMPQQIALNLVGQLCDALDYAHKRRDEQGRPLGIIHRDVTPSNLLLDRTGLLKLVDFGLAKATLATEPSTAGVIKGKLAYVAPEYTHGKIDHRADLWAVGIITYEVLTGRRLFDGHQAMDTLSRVRALPIPRPSIANPRVSQEVDEVVLTALERNPVDRWPSAAAMANRIRAVSARLGDPADNQRVIEWINWAFEQKPGRAVQLTPMVPMPVAPAPVETPSAEVVSPMVGWTSRTIAVLCVIAVLVLGAIAWKIVR